MTNHPYGLLGLLQTETLRDELRKTNSGQQIVDLQDQREVILRDTPIMMGFIFAIVSGLMSLAIIVMVLNLPIELDKSLQGVVVFSLFTGFLIGFFRYATTVAKSASVKGIEEEITRIASCNPEEAEILQRVVESCSYPPVKQN